MLSDAPASPFGEGITGKVVLDLAGFHITITPIYGNPSVISVMSSGNLTLKGSGEISTDGNNVIVNQGILTVMDTVKLTSNVYYGLYNQSTVNLYGGYIAGYTARAAATVNLKNGADTYKTVRAADEAEFTLPNGTYNAGFDFKVVPAVPPEPETPVAKIGDKTYTSLDDAFLSLGTTPGTAEQPVIIEMLADCEVTSLSVPMDAHAVLKSEIGGPYTVSRTESDIGNSLVKVYGELTVENLVLDGGATAGLSSSAPLVSLLQVSGNDPIPHLTLGEGAVVCNNRNQSSQGGGVYISGGTLTLTGGKIYGNSVTGEYNGGGGVYLEDTDEVVTSLELLDGVIRDNTASFAGGVAVGSDALVTVSGSPVVRGNTQNGVESNLYFSDTPLKLTGPLSAEANLGVTLISGAESLGILCPVAQGDSYTITDADYAHFHKDAASEIHELRFQNGKVSLYEPVFITYSTNGGKGDVPRDVGKYAVGDPAMILFDPPLTRQGYFFKGWGTSSGVADPVYAEGGTISIIISGYRHISLFAVWERNPQVLTGAAANITTTSAALVGRVTVYGTFPTIRGFYLRKPTGREELLLNNNGALSTVLTGLTPGIEYEYQAFAKYNGVLHLGENRRFRTQTEAVNPPTGFIDGGVTNNTGKDCAVTVTIEEGNTIRATQTLGVVSSGDRGAFYFANLPDGFYNVVADNGEYKVTRLVEVKGGEVAVDVELTLGKTQSVVEIVTIDTPPAAVNGLPEQFKDENIVDNDSGDTGYASDDKTVVENGGTVELKLSVERKEKDSIRNDADLIAEQAKNQAMSLYLDISLIKTVIPADETAVTTRTKLVSVPKLLTVVFPVPNEAAGKQNITVYRVHNDVAEALSKTNHGGEWAEVNGGNVILHVRQFSTYAVAYDVSVPPPSGGDGGDHNGGGGSNSGSNDDNTPISPKQPETVLPVHPVKQPEAVTDPGVTRPGKPLPEVVLPDDDKPGMEDDIKPEDDSAEQMPDEKDDTQRQKDEILDALEEAIVNLPDDLTDKERQEYIDRLTEIADTAIAALDSTNDPDEAGRITAQALAELQRVSAEAKAGAGKPFVVVSAVFALAALLLAIFALIKRKDKRRKLFTATFAVLGVIAFLLTTGWSGFTLANGWTLVVAVLAICTALGVFDWHSTEDDADTAAN